MEYGLYEQLINNLVAAKLRSLNRQSFFIKESEIDTSEASRIITSYLSGVIQFAMKLISGNDSLETQIILANRIIMLIRDYLDNEEFNENLISTEAKILTAIFPKIDAGFSDFDRYLKEITPITRLTSSELFTGSHSGISLESELKKEILSSDKIMFLVAFIKWTGIRIFEKELTEFTQRGGLLKVITTSYMGATDHKAVDFLSSLKNTEIKVSYNTENERLHAKAYLFFRNTGFHTGYIGSSNISRSALTSGLEWNLKITTKEVAHIIDKFHKTFDTYWHDKEFELFNPTIHSEKLKTALKKEQHLSQDKGFTTFFNVKPFPFQEEILEKLETERTVHSRYKNLVVAATGTGKTVMSGFDYKNFRNNNPSSKLLYVAHRKEILTQALGTFRGILRDNNFGELWVDGIEPDRYEHLFASVQTLNNRLDMIAMSEGYFDFIIIDEVHHIAAESYRPILQKFSPNILLGLTATPERMDGQDILEDFCNVIAAEIRLPEALNRKLLCPFQYFGITDSIDLSRVNWQGGRYVPGELTRIYTTNDIRVGEIIGNLQKYLKDIHDVRALGFCVTQEHARYMAEKFSLAGIKADYLVSNRSEDREILRNKLFSKSINYLFVVDIFNEGVDIPEIDTVLFLRPTESLTVFLQQLGRGLRLAENKDCLTVLDFVGNSRPEYDFEGKFRALVGKSSSSMITEIENDFPHLPLGCSIILEKKAKEFILENIRSATQLNRNQILNRIRNFRHQTHLPLTLKNFIGLHPIPLQHIYKKGNWMRLCVEAGQLPDYPALNEKEVHRAIQKKWLSGSSYSYFHFIKELAENNFMVNLNQLSESEKLMCLMLHYDIWQEPGGFGSLEESIRSIGKNKQLNMEIFEITDLLLRRIDHMEYDIHLPYSCPMKLHSRYTREQILTAFRFSDFNNKSTNREGVAENTALNTEILFIDLIKSENDFSPTTLYNDFAISETLFHWQSQNASRPDTGRGLSYINQSKTNKIILLFVREQKKDEFDNTIPFVFLGDAQFVEYSGSKPMNITWRLSHPMPPYLWNNIAKMAVG